VNYVDFIKIGYYSPTLDIEDYPSNPSEYVGVMFPQNKMKNLKKWLEKHNCEIVR